MICNYCILACSVCVSFDCALFGACHSIPMRSQAKVFAKRTTTAAAAAAVGADCNKRSSEAKCFRPLFSSLHSNSECRPITPVINIHIYTLDDFSIGQKPLQSHELDGKKKSKSAEVCACVWYVWTKRKKTIGLAKLVYRNENPTSILEFESIKIDSVGTKRNGKKIYKHSVHSKQIRNEKHEANGKKWITSEQWKKISISPTYEKLLTHYWNRQLGCNRRRRHCAWSRFFLCCFCFVPFHFSISSFVANFRSDFFFKIYNWYKVISKGTTKQLFSMKNESSNSLCRTCNVPLVLGQGYGSTA